MFQYTGPTLTDGDASESGRQSIDLAAHFASFRGQWTLVDAEAPAEVSAYVKNASIDAVNDSGIDFSKEDPWRCGSIIGTGVGGMDEFAEGHRKLLEKVDYRVQRLEETVSRERDAVGSGAPR